MREWLYNLRNAKGMTLDDLAKKLNISESYMSMIENGERQKRMDITLVSGLANALGIPVETIIKNELGERG